MNIDDLENRFEQIEKNIISKLSAQYDAKYSALTDENAKLSRENEQLRSVNDKLLARIDELLQKFAEKPPPTPSAASSHDTLPSDDSDNDSIYIGDSDSDPDDDPLPISEGSSRTLILSDSVFRHVGSSCPKVAGFRGPIVDNFTLDEVRRDHQVKKIVVPGARTSRLWEEAARAAADPDNNFDNIIVCVGANYTHSGHTPNFALHEIQELLTELGNLYPEARISWSLILPQFHSHSEQHYRSLLQCIRYVNDEMTDFCDDNGFSVLYVPEFSLFLNDYKYVRNQFAQDGVHLNNWGIKAMTAAVREHILSIYMY